MPANPLIIGHRGWSARFPDNSLTGLMAASTVADRVEVDVRRSADGKLVLSHDPEIGGLLVAGTAWSVLAEIDLGEGHRPALLDEALASLPSTPVLLEVKNQPYGPGFEPDHRIALEVAERVRRDDLVTSFNWATVDRVRQVFPEVATGLVTVADALPDALERCHAAGHDAVLPESHSGTELMTDALERGLEVHVWTVDDPVVADELAAIGVSGIITNQPDLIRATLEARE
jgi:glycerophosphoryl diester phosphodiesterase